MARERRKLRALSLLTKDRQSLAPLETGPGCSEELTEEHTQSNMHSSIKPAELKAEVRPTRTSGMNEGLRRFTKPRV